MNFTTDDSGCVRYTSEPQCKCECSEEGQPDVKSVPSQDEVDIGVVAYLNGIATTFKVNGVEVPLLSETHAHLGFLPVQDGRLTADDPWGSNVSHQIPLHPGIYVALDYLRNVVEDETAWPTDRIKAAELLLGL